MIRLTAHVGRSVTLTSPATSAANAMVMRTAVFMVRRTCGGNRLSNESDKGRDVVFTMCRIWMSECFRKIVDVLKEGAGLKKW